MSLSVWNLALALSGFGDPTSSCATAGIALEIMESHKYYSKLEIPLGGSICPSEANSFGLNGLFCTLMKTVWLHT